MLDGCLYKGREGGRGAGGCWEYMKISYHYTESSKGFQNCSKFSMLETAKRYEAIVLAARTLNFFFQTLQSVSLNQMSQCGN